jgi:hypothetical protein
MVVDEKITGACLANSSHAHLILAALTLESAVGM